MWSIAFLAFGSVHIAYKGNVASIPAVFALRNTGVYICSANGGNMASNVKASINEHLSISVRSTIWSTYIVLARCQS